MSEQTSTDVRWTTWQWRSPPAYAAAAARLLPRLLVPEVAVLVVLAIASLWCAIMFPEQMAELALRF
jgi:hypothetical protein